MRASIRWNVLQPNASAFSGSAKVARGCCGSCWSKRSHAAIRKDAELRRFYQRLAERHGRPKAKVAVSRKLLIRAYIMLRDEIDYAEFQRRAVAARSAR